MKAISILDKVCEEGDVNGCGLVGYAPEFGQTESVWTRRLFAGEIVKGRLSASHAVYFYAYLDDHDVRNMPEPDAIVRTEFGSGDVYLWEITEE